ncbi:DUF4093 domain-containing protein [Salmonella enterica]|uniref:DUF4093 domain-containing protein n=1 Tax=Salmonella enterica TaxID=28901 RepID=UPI0034D32312
MDKSELLRLGVIDGKDARRRRVTISRKMRIGFTNSMLLLKKLILVPYTHLRIPTTY